MDLQTAQRLYEYRKANGYSQEELAEKIGVSRQAISKWERSESSPDTDNLIALAKLYGITIDELINGTDEPKKAAAPEPEKAEASDPEKAAMPEPEIADAPEEAAPPQEVSPEQGAADPAAPKGDNVDISLKNGINVDSANGDSVHIGIDGIKVNSANSPEFNENILKNAKKTNPLFDAIVACAGFLLFFLTGFLCSGGWAYSWLFLLMIPVIITAGEAFRSKNPSVFCYSVLMVVLYCGLGLVAHIWHPTWILFITIPLYYILCDAYKKAKPPVTEQAAAQSASGTYYTPDAVTGAAYTQEQSGNKTARVILGVIIGFMIAAVIGVFAIAAGYHIYSFAPGPVIISNDLDDYTVGAGEVAADEVNSLEIDWVNGSINVEYYDGSTVSFTETEQSNPDRQLRYKVKDGTLEIIFCKEAISGIDGLNIDSYSKDLTVYIPSGKELTELDVDNVSAKATLNQITANKIDVDTVSGSITATGSFSVVDIDSVSATAAITADERLRKLSVDSVSASTTVYLPAATTGFEIDSDSISGHIDASDFTKNGSTVMNDGKISYGDGLISIGFDTVSGNLVIKAY